VHTVDFFPGTFVVALLILEFYNAGLTRPHRALRTFKDETCHRLFAFLAFVLSLDPSPKTVMDTVLIFSDLFEASLAYPHIASRTLEDKMWHMFATFVTVALALNPTPVILVVALLLYPKLRDYILHSFRRRSTGFIARSDFLGLCEERPFIPCRTLAGLPL
jgi:hypothetical protein